MKISTTDMKLITNRTRSGAAKRRKRYSTAITNIKIASKQKNNILYLSPHERVPARPGLKPQGTIKI